jgi:hypothetical protein
VYFSDPPSTDILPDDPLCDFDVKHGIVFFKTLAICEEFFKVCNVEIFIVVILLWKVSSIVNSSFGRVICIGTI